MGQRPGGRSCQNWASRAGGIIYYCQSLAELIYNTITPLLGVLRPEGGAGESEPAADGRSQQEVHPPGGHG